MHRPTHVYVDQSALVHNLNIVRKLAPRSSIVAMVKADAYGCGFKSVLPILEGRVDLFGVVSLDEAIEIRKLGMQTPCMLLHGVYSQSELSRAARLNCEIVINDAIHLDLIAKNSSKDKCKIWVKVDTGMGRFGFKPADLAGVLNQLEHHMPRENIGVMTHFACADTPDSSKNKSQLDCFFNLPIKKYKKSLANSALVMTEPLAHADYVRPGIMLYGASPINRFSSIELGLKPVMNFYSKIINIHEIKKGDTVGYGASWQALRDSKIAVIPVGYGDGYPRLQTKQNYVWVKGDYAPLVGTISMDSLTVDVTSLMDINIGDDVEIWGKHVLVEDVAKSANTISYELLTKVTQRVYRKF